MPQEYSFVQRHEIEGRATGNSQLQLEKRTFVKSIKSLEYMLLLVFTLISEI